MKRSILLLALVLTALIGAQQASATMYACAGTPTDDAYRQAFDTVRGQLKDGNVRYPYKTTLWEHQSWLTPVGQEPGHGSEHLHLKACIPQGETLTTGNGTEWIDLAVSAHNVSGYKATSLSGSYVSLNGSQSAFTATTAQLDLITNAMQTSGHLGLNTGYLSLPLKAVTSNGLKELRWMLTVERSDSTALVERWRLDARNYWTHAYPGLASVAPVNDQVRYIRNRTIIDFVKADGSIGSGYHHAGLCNQQGTAIACDSDEWDTAYYTTTKSANWAQGTRVTDGGGPATFEIDPNHHVHPDDRGKWFLDWYQFRGPDSAQFMTHTIPLGTLGLTKWHKLFFGSDNQPECVRLGQTCPPTVPPEWRDVVVMPFKTS